MEKKYVFLVDSEVDIDKRLDVFLAEKLENFSRAKIQKLIETENVVVNSKISNKKYKTKLNDLVELSYVVEKIKCIEAQNIELEVLYEDDYVAVINKPKEMNVQIDEYHRSETLVNALMYRFKTLSNIGGEERLGIVHRLDKNTTGAIIICKTNYAFEDIKSQFQDRSIYKEYIAIVRGGFSDKTGVISEPIGRHPKERVLRAVAGENSKEAITHYEVLEEKGQYTLVKCILETGRTHQIRVHMKHIKHPILGDSKYGIKNDKYFNYNQFLHSHKIAFNHVKTGARIEVISPIPKYFEKIWQELK